MWSSRVLSKYGLIISVEGIQNRCARYILLSHPIKPIRISFDTGRGKYSPGEVELDCLRYFKTGRMHVLHVDLQSSVVAAIKVTLWASWQIRKLWVAHAPGMPGTLFPRPWVSDPNMHHDTCVTHVSWCMPGSLTNGFLWSRWLGKTFPAFPEHAQFYVSSKRPTWSGHEFRGITGQILCDRVKKPVG